MCVKAHVKEVEGEGQGEGEGEGEGEGRGGELGEGAIGERRFNEELEQKVESEPDIKVRAAFDWLSHWHSPSSLSLPLSLSLSLSLSPSLSLSLSLSLPLSLPLSLSLSLSLFLCFQSMPNILVSEPDTCVGDAPVNQLNSHNR